MAKLGLAFVIALVLLAFISHSYGSSAEEKPSFTDCRPHIDATIRNLAAKAVNAGQEPTEPQKSDYASPEETDDSLPKIPDIIEKQENLEGTPEQNAQIKPEIFISVKKALELKRQHEANKNNASPASKHHSSTNTTKQVAETKKKYQPIEIKKAKSDHTTEKRKSADRRTEKTKQEKYKGKEWKKDKKQKKVEGKAAKGKNSKDDKHRKSAHKDKYSDHKKDKQHHKHDQKESRFAREDREKDDVKQETHKREESVKPDKHFAQQEGKSSKPQAQMGIFNRFIMAIFGAPQHERDKKFSVPWTTHKEFVKAPAKAAEKRIKGEPGMISKLINKCVALAFGLPETKRASKWSQPWQTHEGFNAKGVVSKKEKVKTEIKEKPWEKKGFFSFSFLNAFIEMIFEKPKAGRDPKFSKPWTTHKEFQRSQDAKSSSGHNKIKTKVNHSKPSQGGIFNSVISLFFEIPTGIRDPKWNEPWQSHQEMAKTEKQPKPKEVKKATESGIIGNFFNKLVFLVFQKPTKPRDTKWSEPWQTHAETIKTPQQKEKKPVKVDKQPGFIGASFNSFVGLIFGNNKGRRDPKFASPWQTHPDFAKLSKTPKQEASKDSKPPTHKPTQAQQPAKKIKEEAAEFSTQSESKAHHAEKEYRTAKTEHQQPKPVDRTAFHSSSKDAHHPTTVHSTSDNLADIPKKSDRSVLEKVVEQKKERKEKVIEYDEQIIVVPSHVRSRDHIISILGLDTAASHSSYRSDQASQTVLKDLKGVYEEAISPLEKTYKYQDISNRHLSDAELYGPPVVLLLGPYSTGKSSFINYLLGVEFTKRALKTGTPPSHGVFRIIQYGDHDRDIDGTEVSGQWLFSSLQKFGQNFVDQIKGKTLNVPLLKKATFVEAPGVLEMRRPNERLYPFNDVLQWFIDRADLILVMFDYTKLDAGYEMEAILDQLKGRESQTRILLNKADQVPPEELIKVQGSLFWNLSPLLGVNAPPTVYAGSYASFQYRPTSPIKLFQAQEEALLHDIASAFKERINNRIAIVRRHAVRVRNHAQMVDTYLNTFYKNKGFLTSKHKLAEDIIDSPHDYNIYEGLTLQTNVSRYDLPDAEVYRDFFRIHNLYDFRTLRQTCSYIGGCPLEKIGSAINKDLPALMKKYRQLKETGDSRSHSPPTFGREESSHAGAHARTGKL